MSFQIDNKSGVPFYRQIIEQVKHGIARGRLAPGDQLPTVRQLAVDLSVNPNTVIRGYRELEIVVINDGSADRTLAELTEAFGLRRLDRVYRRSVKTGEVRGIYGSLEVPNLVVIDKDRGGRADALNAGINLSRYPLICPVESGTFLEDDALLQVVRPFLLHPEETVAASGLFRRVDEDRAREPGAAFGVCRGLSQDETRAAVRMIAADD